MEPSRLGYSSSYCSATQPCTQHSMPDDRASDLLDMSVPYILSCDLSVGTCQRCLIELQNLGFIRCTEKGAFSPRRCMQVCGAIRGRLGQKARWGPTREYEAWQPQNNSRMQVSHEPNANLSEKEGNTPVTDAETATGQSGKPLVPANSTSDRIASLTSYQGSLSEQPKTEQRKQANSYERTDLADLW